MSGQAGGGIALIGQGLAQLLGSALGASSWGQALMTNVRYTRAQITEIRRTLMALTQAQQAAINELAEGINTLSENLDGVLEAAESVKAELAEMTAEEGREQAERERLRALLDQLDADVVGALQPLTNQIAAMNTSLQTPEGEGGSPITPGDPTTPTEPPMNDIDQVERETERSHDGDGD